MKKMYFLIWGELSLYQYLVSQPNMILYLLCFNFLPELFLLVAK